MRYFTITPTTTLADIKAQYRALAKQHHPDRGGSPEAMRQVILEYNQCLKSIAADRQNPDSAQANELLTQLMNLLRQKYQPLYSIISLYANDDFGSLLADMFTTVNQKANATDTDTVVKNLFSKMLR